MSEFATLDTIESKKYEKVSREYVEDVERGGVVFEKYRQLVTKNGGEMQDYITVEVPKDFGQIAKLSDEKQQDILDKMKVQIITAEANKFRRTGLVSEEEKQEKVNQTVQTLRNLGLDEDEIAEML